ncbi:MAG: DUF937 domain-containing protein [Proteobacteria bacterium]|nr:DUF937 domain-containing protein [Pseudomonadota bacterium]
MAADDSQAGGIDGAVLARVAARAIGAGRGGPPRGLGALAASFERAGLGHEFASWVGNGPNLPIDAAGLERALTPGWIALVARLCGRDRERVAAALADILPRVVDELTPAGVLPGAAAGRSP